MDLHLVYITAKESDEAKKIGRTLVQEKLAVCANIFNDIDSIYEWEGSLRQEKEAVLIVKAKGSVLQDLIVRAKELSSYDCPCIVSLPIEGGHKDYLDWLAG